MTSLPSQTHQHERGIALIIGLFVITLTSAITIYIARQTYYSTRLHKNTLQRLQGEYLLKSGLNVARLLVSTGSGSVDPAPGTWGPFIQGIEVDATILGVNQPNVILGLEISAENARLSLTTGLRQFNPENLTQAGGASSLALDQMRRIARLFRALGFEDDNEVPARGQPFEGRFFGPEQLVANLVDYMDQDAESVVYEDFVGIESELPEGREFPVRGRIPQKMYELAQIPGFTPNRLRKLTPYVTLATESTININLTSPLVLQSMFANIPSEEAQAGVELARGPEGPLDQQGLRELPSVMPSLPSSITGLAVSSDIISVVAKAEFGASRYFIRARLQKNSKLPGKNSLPAITDYEFFG